MKSKRKYRLNIIITYYKEIDPVNYREPLMQILQNIAWLHRLDFASSIDHQFDFDADLQTAEILSEITDDIVYFRQTSETRISIKDLRRLIHDLFQLSPLAMYGVDVDYQLQKALPEYPFPKNFLRFLKYPYVEVHKGSHKSLSIFADPLLSILGEGQDASMN